MIQVRKPNVKWILLSLQVLALGGLILGLSACSEATATPTVTLEHPSYNYSADLTQLSTTQKWKSGDELKIAWKAQQKEISTSSKPIQISLQLALYGPTTTKEEAEKLMASGNPVAQTPVLQTDSWNGQPFASTLILPPGLAAGTYQLVAQVEYLDPATASRNQTSSTTAITVGG